MTTGNVRPADMERITTPELAQKFIEEQIAELRAQIGDKKVFNSQCCLSNLDFHQRLG